MSTVFQLSFACFYVQPVWSLQRIQWTMQVSAWVGRLQLLNSSCVVLRPLAQPDQPPPHLVRASPLLGSLPRPTQYHKPCAAVVTVYPPQTVWRTF
ncbi:hypothetical protein BKA83DRAFT_682200 [Pisolithus microcarpus]|nr:hypothetical protein BKA83DRAFT_682200 [Pisolithus microcarpus]